MRKLKFNIRLMGFVILYKVFSLIVQNIQTECIRCRVVQAYSSSRISVDF